MTWFDVIDALFVAACATAWYRSRLPFLGWAVLGLAMLHLMGRYIITNHPEPLLSLGLLYTGAALCYLVSPILSNYGRLIGTVLACMGMVSFGHEAFAVPIPAQDGGLGFDLWNALSVGLHVVAGLTLAGIWRYERYCHSRPCR